MAFPQFEYKIILTEEAISVDTVKGTLSFDSSCGAVISFEGVVRREKKIEGIFYECYTPMAEEELKRILFETREKFPVEKIGVAHRLNNVAAGETSLVLVVASTHRREAFAASEYFIEELKKRVPIWKKELYDDQK